MSEEKTVCHGYLYKEGKINKSWKNRYVKLSESKLEYFRKRGQKATGIIPMKSGVLIGLAPERDMEHCFKIITNYRCFYFAAPNRAVLNEWMDKIRNVLKPTKRNFEKVAPLKILTEGNDRSFEEVLEVFGKNAEVVEDIDKMKLDGKPMQKFHCSLQEDKLVTLYSPGIVYILQNLILFQGTEISRGSHLVFSFSRVKSVSIFSDRLTILLEDPEISHTFSPTSVSEKDSRSFFNLIFQIKETFEQAGIQVEDSESKSETSSHSEEAMSRLSQETGDSDVSSLRSKSLPNSPASKQRLRLTLELKMDINFNFRKKFNPLYKQFSNDIYHPQLPEEESVIYQFFSFHFNAEKNEFLSGLAYITRNFIWFSGKDPTSINDKAKWAISIEDITEANYSKNCIQIKIPSGVQYLIVKSIPHAREMVVRYKYLPLNQMKKDKQLSGRFLRILIHLYNTMYPNKDPMQKVLRMRKLPNYELPPIQSHEVQETDSSTSQDNPHQQIVTVIPDYFPSTPRSSGEDENLFGTPIRVFGNSTTLHEFEISHKKGLWRRQSVTLSVVQSFENGEISIQLSRKGKILRIEDASNMICVLLDSKSEHKFYIRFKDAKQMIFFEEDDSKRANMVKILEKIRKQTNPDDEFASSGFY